ncbi:MAG: dienelactone hydrolase family protein, partial [Myxococcales bacterium]|nr:dienelactone hydrolase family protein [Myxococcales bacterium]
MKTERFEIEVDHPVERLDAELVGPAGPSLATLLLAHGAGAGMDHGFMVALSRELAEVGLSSLRFNFPYKQEGKRLPRRSEELDEVTAEVMGFCAAKCGDQAMFLSGKSMGGRVLSRVCANSPEAGAAFRGLIFFGFPLHNAKKPSVRRAAHLPKVRLPMLFLQGTRDALAELNLVDTAIRPLTNAQVHVLEGADHGFSVLKRSGRTDEEVLREISQTTASFVERVL